MKRVLFLCTGNSARSVIAEGLLRHLGQGRYLSYSAGSQPTGTPNPAALDVLRAHDIDASFARSKSWDEFAAPDGDIIDIVITVCSNAAGEICPIWPGHPVTAHWGVDDPVAITSPPEEVAKAFQKTFDEMSRRINALLALDENLDDVRFVQMLRAIGKIDD